MTTPRLVALSHIKNNKNLRAKQVVVKLDNKSTASKKLLLCLEENNLGDQMRLVS